MKWTEHSMQSQLALHCRGHQHELHCPNFTGFPWFENDLVSITRAGLVHVFEIKVSRSDFLSEFGPGRAKSTKRERIDFYNRRDKRTANYFWLAVGPDVLRDTDEIPDYAGIIHIQKPEGKGWNPWIKVGRDAPRLHRNKVDPHTMQALARGVAVRYWSHRIDKHMTARSK